MADVNTNQGGADYSPTLIRAAEETLRRTVYREADPNKQDPSSPDYQSASYREQIGDVTLMREVYGGTKSMRAQKKKYLPQHPMEVDGKYADRLNIAIAYNALRKTVEGLTGMIFRRDPQLSPDMPAPVQKAMEDVDLRGNKLAVFLRKVADNALLDGHTWIHVEAPRTDGLRNQAEAEAAGVRPYWINVKKSAAINWRYAMRSGKAVLTLFVYCEASVLATGEFGEEERQRIRVLREGAVNPENGVFGDVLGELWELQKVQQANGQTIEKWVRIEQYTVGVTTLPVVCVYADQDGPFESRPPLQDLAYEQIEHYRVRSERQKNLTFASIAVPYVFGENVTDDEGEPRIKWGADGMLLLNDPNATAGMLESAGNGLAAGLEELNTIRENMASLGLRMLMRTPTAAKPATATSDLLNKSESNASLATFAVALEDATNQCLIMHGEYEGEANPGTVEINRDFHEQLVDPAFITAIGNEVAQGHLSLDTMWAMLVAGELLPEDFDPETERTLIEKDGAAGLVTTLVTPAVQAAQPVAQPAVPAQA